MRAKDWKVEVHCPSGEGVINRILVFLQDHIIPRHYSSFDTVIGGAYSVSAWNFFSPA